MTTVTGSNIGDLNGSTVPQAQACRWCSGNGLSVFHQGTCPRVKSIEYDGSGNVKKVEFKEGV